MAFPFLFPRSQIAFPSCVPQRASRSRIGFVPCRAFSLSCQECIVLLGLDSCLCGARPIIHVLFFGGEGGRVRGDLNRHSPLPLGVYHPPSSFLLLLDEEACLQLVSLCPRNQVWTAHQQQQQQQEEEKEPPGLYSPLPRGLWK